MSTAVRRPAADHPWREYKRAQRSRRPRRYGDSNLDWLCLLAWRNSRLLLDKRSYIDRRIRQSVPKAFIRFVEEASLPLGDIPDGTFVCANPDLTLRIIEAAAHGRPIREIGEALGISQQLIIQTLDYHGCPRPIGGGRRDCSTPVQQVVDGAGAPEQKDKEQWSATG